MVPLGSHQEVNPHPPLQKASLMLIPGRGNAASRNARETAEARMDEDSSGAGDGGLLPPASYPQLYLVSGQWVPLTGSQTHRLCHLLEALATGLVQKCQNQTWPEVSICPNQPPQPFLPSKQVSSKGHLALTATCPSHLICSTDIEPKRGKDMGSALPSFPFCAGLWAQRQTVDPQALHPQQPLRSGVEQGVGLNQGTSLAATTVHQLACVTEQPAR